MYPLFNFQKKKIPTDKVDIEKLKLSDKTRFRNWDRKTNLKKCIDQQKEV